MTRRLDLDFHGTTIRVLSQHAVLDVLAAEFQAFRAEVATPRFTVELIHAPVPRELLPAVAATRTTANALEYRFEGVRWHDFHGQALSSWVPARRHGCLWSPDADRLHELGYLMILSLTGKALDQAGLHKVHACAFRYRGRDVLVMLPSHGGKTTLLLELARLPGVALLSDDTPLVDATGRVHPFPLRVGVHAVPAHLPGSFPVFKRAAHGDKYLIPLPALGSPIAQGPGEHPVLIFGQRWPRPDSHFQRLGPLTALRGLTTHMVVGVGLPMVVEWFLEHTPADWLRLSGIAAARLRAALRLWQRGESWAFTMGEDPAANARALLRFLERR